MLPSSQTGFNLVNAAVVYAIMDGISGLELSSDITEPRYFKLVTVSSFCPVTLILFVDAAGVSCHQLGLIGTDLHAEGCGGFVETRNFFFFPVLLPLLLRSKEEIGDYSDSNADSGFVVF